MNTARPPVIRGTITQVEETADGWSGIVFGTMIHVAGKLSGIGNVVEIRFQGAEERFSGVYRIRRKARKAQPKQPPSPEREAAILAAREQGKTLRVIGEEFGLSVERIRGIVARAERKRADPNAHELSVRAINVIKNTLPMFGHDDGNSYYGFKNPKAVAEQVASAGVKTLKDSNNCGKKTIAEIEAWLNKYDFSFRPPEPTYWS